MALYALDNLDDALDATRAFLWPVDRTTWVKLALVTLFVGGPGANFGGSQYSAGGDGGAVPGAVPPTDFGPRAWLLVVGVVGVLVLLALAFAFVGSVMEFVFVESLRNRAVTVRRYWGRRWRQGARLFGFRLILGLFTLGAVLLFAAPFALPLLGFDAGFVPAGGALLGLLVVLVPVFVVLAVVVSLVDGFTTAFVVPIMLLEDCGVLDGWRRLWPTIPAQWTQYLAYVVAGFFLSLFGGLLVAVVTAVLAFALLVPFGLLFALGVGLLVFVFEPLGIAALVAFGLLYALAVVAAAALVQAPVQTYLRYYALLVLGDVDSTFDLIPDQRRAVRGEDGDPAV